MKEVETYYDGTSKKYDQVFSTLYYKICDTITWKYLEPYVPTDPEAVVLDAAGGTGRWTVKMAAKGAKIVLMDSSEGMLKVAAGKLKDALLDHNVTMRKGDIANTGFPDETFDMILCEHALFLFKNPEPVMKELARILKRDCPIVISAQNRYVGSLSILSDRPDAENVAQAFKTLVGESHVRMRNDKVAVYTWTPDEFWSMLERNRLRVNRIIGKVVTIPLRIKEETYCREVWSKGLYDNILGIELALCERQDALALAGHVQAIACKS